MRRLLIGLAIGGLAVSASLARAEDSLGGHFGVGAAVSNHEGSNAKYREFFYDMKSGFVLSPDAAVHYSFALGDIPMFVETNLNGRTALERRATEGDADFSIGSKGLFTIRGSFKRIGHQFAHDAQSLYSGIGTNDLTINNDAFRSNMQVSTDATVRSNLLAAAEQQAQLVDIGLRRDQVSAGFDVAALEPVTIAVDFAGEHRRGARSFGALFGSSPGAAAVIEVAEPIDYQTLNTSARIGYAEKLPLFGGVPVTAAVTAANSTFENANDSVTIDNPFSLTDSKTGGAARGRYALAPSNSANSIAGDLRTALPYHIGLSGHASYAVLRQDQALLPATTNSWFTVPALPRGSADAEVVKSYYAAEVTYSPVSRLHYLAKWTQRRYENKTEEFAPALVVVGDTATQANNVSEYVSFTARSFEGEQTVDLGRRTHLVGAFEHEVETFVNGTSPRMTQNAFKAAVDTAPTDGATVRVSGEHAVRDSDYADNVAASSEAPWNRKYYAAARDRDQVTILSTIAILESCDLSLQHSQGVDNYPESKFGIQTDEHRASTVDLTYAPDASMTINTYYTLEAYHLHQRERQWNPGAAGDPYTRAPGEEDPSNWTADSTSTINTIGMSSDYVIVPDKLSARIEGSGSVTKGGVDFESLVGAINGSTPSATSVLDATSFIPVDFPNVDSSRFLNAGVTLAYKATAAITISLGYRYNVWQYQDDLLNGDFPEPIALNAFGGYNSLVSMGIIPKNYQVHTAVITVSSTF